MMLRILAAAALLAVAGVPLAQTSKDSSGKLDTTGRPIPEQCAGLTGEKRQECIKKHAKR